MPERNPVSIPEPDVTPVNEPHWQGLKDGALKFQQCEACGHAWLPTREDCPNCLHHGYRWQDASGRGTLVSWVVYHVVFNKAFADRVPYNVAVVELEEGPRAITNIVNPEDGLRADRPVELVIEQDEGISLARFRLV